MRTLSLAVRNLLRNTRRTALTAAAVAFGLGMVIFVVALGEGTYQDMIKGGISQLSGHVVVQAHGWQDEREDTLVVQRSTEVARIVAEAVPDAVIARRIHLAGLLVSPTSAVGVGLQGVDPEPEAAVSHLDDWVVEGSWVGSDDRGVVIGRALADSLGVGIGDRVVYMGQHGQPEMISRLFRVQGIFRSGAAELDGFVAVASVTAAQELLEVEDAVHQVTVHLPSDTSAQARDDLLARLDGHDLDVRTWIDALPELYAMIEVDRASTDVILGILLLIVAMGVLNTVLMSTLERTREFGVMRAVGMRPAQLAGLVLTEGLVLGVVGSALGLVMGAAIVLPLSAIGIDYGAMAGGEQLEMSGVVMNGVIYPVWIWSRILLYCAVAVAFTILSASWPAWRTARLRPVEAMRHV